MTRIAQVAVALVLVLTSGWVAGNWTGRWTSTVTDDVGVAPLEELPPVLGDWVSKQRPVETRQLDSAGVVRHVSRTYTHQIDGRSVSLLLVVGPRGPIAVHPPDVCSVGIGYTLLAAPSKHRPPELERNAAFADCEFHVADFRKISGGAASYMRVIWAWSAGKGWEVPDVPRMHYAGSQHLYKLYVSRPLRTARESLEGDACVAFLEILLPEIEKLFQGPSVPANPQLETAKR